MTQPPPLDDLLRRVFEQELSERGLQPGPEARSAAWSELSRSLRPEASSALSCAALEVALARAGSVAAGEAVAPEPPRAPAPSAVPRSLAVGDVLDAKYEIEALLSEGGFGKVYRARDRALDCAVAIKVLKADASGEKLAELQEEARRLTRLRHPNIVEWKTLNRTADGLHYLVMELLEGELLEDVLRREGKLAPARAARILLELCDALGHAHALPDGSCLLHLDLKPTNVFLVHDRPGTERVKVLDFGISRFAHASRAPVGPLAEVRVPAGATTSFATATGALACTPLYCSPEQAARILGSASAAALDARSDLFSLGVLGYRMLTGRFPHESAPDLLTTLRWREQRAPLAVAAAGVSVPRRLARFVERCLALAPAARFADARAAHAELARILAPRPVMLLAAAAACVVALGVIAWALGNAPDALAPLHAAVSATGRSATREPLWFGPARPSIALALADVPVTELAAVRLVDAPGQGGDATRGWQARVRAGALELTAEAGRTRRASAILLLESARGRRASEPIELVYVEPSAWELVSADVPGRGARGVDPRGQALEVVVRGMGAALPDALELRLGERAWAVERDGPRSRGDRALYALELAQVDWGTASAAPRVRLEDRAGNVLERALELPLVHEPLVVASLALAGTAPSAGRWHVLAGEPVELVASGNRPARLRWTLDDTDGRRIDAGASPAGALAHRLALDTGRWPARGFEGVLRVVLEEDEWVAHAPEVGAARAELALELRSTGAVFDVSLSGARSWIEAGLGDPVYYVGGDALRAAVSRAHDVPMLVTAACARDGGAPAVQELSFAAPQEERKAVELALGPDGRHRLVLEGRRLGADERPLERVDLARELAVIRDTRAPRVELEGWREDLVLRSPEELGALAFRVRVEDEAFGPESPPASVHWSLVALQDARPFELASGELSVTPGTPAALPREPLAALPDGRYVLALRATDFSGNQDEPREHPWSVSSEGPRLEVLVPEDGEPWVRTSEVFTVELRAEDPNGVARVECELSDEKGVLPPRRVALEPLPAPAGATTRWLARFELDHRWAGRRVNLRLRGTDALGSESLRPVDVACTVGAIPSLVPEHVEVGRPGSAPARMRRVSGNAAVAYLFAGRGDYLENAAFRACNLGDYSDRTLTSSLRLECPPGSIADFYLDEHEVSVAQVLAFVRAGDGWTDARHWPADAPDEERRRALEQELARSEPTLPATGLTCLEAQAFASWTGKSLPTYLQWEYAVRGLQARPFSFFDAAQAVPSLVRVNVGTGVAWPVGRGEDRTPDTRIGELCSNVAEWTSTPAARPLAALPVAELLAPAPARPGVRHYVVGGGFDRSVFHFGTIARRACEEASPSVGFRCMLPAARVEAAFLDQSEDLQVLPVR